MIPSTQRNPTGTTCGSSPCLRVIHALAKGQANITVEPGYKDQSIMGIMCLRVRTE